MKGSCPAVAAKKWNRNLEGGKSRVEGKEVEKKEGEQGSKAGTGPAEWSPGKGLQAKVSKVSFYRTWCKPPIS